jgi:hypothetical protein
MLKLESLYDEDLDYGESVTPDAEIIEYTLEEEEGLREIVNANKACITYTKGRSDRDEHGTY